MHLNVVELHRSNLTRKLTCLQIPRSGCSLHPTLKTCAKFRCWRHALRMVPSSTRLPALVRRTLLPSHSAGILLVSILLTSTSLWPAPGVDCCYDQDRRTVKNVPRVGAIFVATSTQYRG